MWQRDTRIFLPEQNENTGALPSRHYVNIYSHHSTLPGIWVQVNTSNHIFTSYQYRSVTVLHYSSSRRLSRGNDMQLFLGEGPSQRPLEGNYIFKKWPGKLLIIVPFVALQFLCPKKLSSH